MGNLALLNKEYTKTDIYALTKMAYEQIAPLYSEKCSSINSVFPIARKFIVRLKQHSKILDVGCGSGRDLKFFSSLGYRAMGIDNSRNLVKIARSSCNCKVLEMDVLSINLREEKFDAIWANAILHHITDEDIPNVLNEFHSLLRTKGKLFISVRQNETSTWDYTYPNAPRYYNQLNRAKLTRFLRESNFQIDNYIENTGDSNWMIFFAHKK